MVILLAGLLAMMHWLIKASLAPEVTQAHWVQSAVTELKAHVGMMRGDIRQLNGAVQGRDCEVGYLEAYRLSRGVYEEREPDPENPVVSFRVMLFALGVVVIVVILLVFRVHELIF